MRIPSNGFKLCLAALALGLGLWCGCQTTASKPKNWVANLRLYLETNPDAAGNSMSVPVYRGSPVMINVEKSPFLDERYVTNAVVVGTTNIFAIKVQFDNFGRVLLEEYSTANRSLRCVIFSQYGEKKKFQQRWLAAPMFTQTIKDGTLEFTPDASREEADKIVRGLMNTTKENRKNNAW